MDGFNKTYSFAFDILRVKLQISQLVLQNINLYGQLVLDAAIHNHSTSFLNWCLCRNHNSMSYADGISRLIASYQDGNIYPKIIHVFAFVKKFLNNTEVSRFSNVSRIFVAKKFAVYDDVVRSNYGKFMNIYMTKEQWLVAWKNEFCDFATLVKIILFDCRIWSAESISTLHLQIIENILDDMGSDYDNDDIEIDNDNCMESETKNLLMESPIMIYGIISKFVSYCTKNDYLFLSFTCMQIWEKFRNPEIFVHCIELTHPYLSDCHFIKYHPSCSDWYYFNKAMDLTCDVSQVVADRIEIPQHIGAKLRGYGMSHMLLHNPKATDYGNIKLLHCSVEYKQKRWHYYKNNFILSHFFICNVSRVVSPICLNSDKVIFYNSLLNVSDLFCVFHAPKVKQIVIYDSDIFWENVDGINDNVPSDVSCDKHLVWMGDRVLDTFSDFAECDTFVNTICKVTVVIPADLADDDLAYSLNKMVSKKKWLSLKVMELFIIDTEYQHGGSHHYLFDWMIKKCDKITNKEKIKSCFVSIWCDRIKVVGNVKNLCEIVSSDEMKQQCAVWSQLLMYGTIEENKISTSEFTERWQAFLQELC